MVSKRTKASAVLFVLCAVYVYVTEYKDFRRDQALRAQYRGQEYTLQLLEEPYMSPSVKGAFSMGTISLVVMFVSAAIDIRRLRHRRQR
jgi:hypothetical protein